MALKRATCMHCDGTGVCTRGHESGSCSDCLGWWGSVGERKNCKKCDGRGYIWVSEDD